MKAYSYSIHTSDDEAIPFQERFFVPGKCEFGFYGGCIRYYTTNAESLNRAQMVVDGKIVGSTRARKVCIPKDLVDTIIDLGAVYESAKEVTMQQKRLETRLLTRMNKEMKPLRYEIDRETKRHLG